ncbi:hypothetical protein ALP79_200104 [Pseudomonas savastanoi pv. fraxini]|nr:hypothetical protein ALP79_200104 [Pseudomonas savastanoi pv. fraxini]
MLYLSEANSGDFDRSRSACNKRFTFAAGFINGIYIIVGAWRRQSFGNRARQERIQRFLLIIIQKSIEPFLDGSQLSL